MMEMVPVTLVVNNRQYAVEFHPDCLPVQGDTIALPGLTETFVVMHRAYQCHPPDSEGFMEAGVTHIFARQKSE